MLVRCRAPTLTRTIASSATLPPVTKQAVSRDSESKREHDHVKTKDPDDPWAPVFDDIDNTVPPVLSPHPHLHSRFFTSRPSPKTFFNSNNAYRRRAPSGRRGYGTNAARPGEIGNKHDGSNKTVGSAWDHVFEGIDGAAATIAPHSNTLGAGLAARRPARRHAMTAREVSAFDDMFDMIFTAVSKSKERGAARAASEAEMADEVYAPSPSVGPSSSTATSEPPPAPAESIGGAPLGTAPDLFGKLRRQSNRMRRTSATDELLDRKKEEMARCDTDQELFEWALREVFGEPGPSSSSTASPSSAPPPSPSSELARYLADPTYPHVLAHLMRTFRTRYHDAHTALALFAHAKRRSVHSYVFGCTTPAYNELLEARWARDGLLALGDIEAALAEMRANGVNVDRRTRDFVERVRMAIGEGMLGQKQSSDEAEAEVWDALERIEALVRKKGERGNRDEQARESKFDARRRHWDEEWKAGIEEPRLGEDRLSLRG